MEQLEKYDEYLKEHLSQKRYTHSKNVSDASVMLAKKFGYPDVEKARFAGLVHDICKEGITPSQEQECPTWKRSSIWQI